jgi:hypothetical protein
MAGGGGSPTGALTQQQPTGGLSQPLMFKPTSMPTNMPTSVPSQPQVQQPATVFNQPQAQQPSSGLNQPVMQQPMGGFGFLSDNFRNGMAQAGGGTAQPGGQIMGGMGQTGGSMALANTQGTQRPMDGFTGMSNGTNTIGGVNPQQVNTAGIGSLPQQMSTQQIQQAIQRILSGG